MAKRKVSFTVTEETYNRMIAYSKVRGKNPSNTTEELLIRGLDSVSDKQESFKVALDRIKHSCDMAVELYDKLSKERERKRLLRSMPTADNNGMPTADNNGMPTADNNGMPTADNKD